jgi:CubicO group peptidase (beta-lactamase class C family)
MLKEAFTHPRLNNGSLASYGFGWGLGNYDGEITYSHAGRYGGFNTYIKRFPKLRNTIIFLTNHDFKNMDSIGNAIINALFNNS